VEDAAERALLPETRNIKAGPIESFTSSNGKPLPGGYNNWYRSHGDGRSTKFSSLSQINRSNVARLKPVWTYRPGTGNATVQANPVMALGNLYFPTGGHDIVALDAVSGTEVWKHTPGGQFPAKRGMIYVDDLEGIEPFLSFPVGSRLLALNAETGKQSQALGGGEAGMGYPAKIAPVRFGDMLVIASVKPAVLGIDMGSGKVLWETNILPENQPSGPGGKPSKLSGGNPWGGMALDEARGIAYIATSNPGPVLVGVERPGDRVTGKPVFDFKLRRAPVSRLPGERTAPYQPELDLPQPFAKQAFEPADVTDIGEENRKSVLEQLETRNFGFYEPYEEGVETVFFGLHGGAQWPGAAADPARGLLYVASSHLPSMTTVINTAGQGDDSGRPDSPGRKIYQDKCADCHGANREGGDGPALVWLSQRLSKHRFSAIVRDGFQAMAPVEGVSTADVGALADYLFSIDAAKTQIRNQSRRSGDYRFVRTQYRKLKDLEGYPGSKPPWGTLNRINLNTGKIEWRVALGEHAALYSSRAPKTAKSGRVMPIPAKSCGHTNCHSTDRPRR